MWVGLGSAEDPPSPNDQEVVTGPAQYWEVTMEVNAAVNGAAAAPGVALAEQVSVQGSTVTVPVEVQLLSSAVTVSVQW